MYGMNSEQKIHKLQPKNRHQFNGEYFKETKLSAH